MRKESVHVEKDILINEDGIILIHPSHCVRRDATLYRIIKIVRHLPSNGRRKSDPRAKRKRRDFFCGIDLLRRRRWRR